MTSSSETKPLVESNPKFALVKSSPKFWSFLSKHIDGLQRQLLLALANLEVEGIAHFRRGGQFMANLRAERPFKEAMGGVWSVCFGGIPDKKLLSTRDELRRVWDEAEAERLTLLNAWLAEPESVKVSLRLGGGFQLSPNYGNSHAWLLSGALRHGADFAICRNPNCPARYFFKRRRTQKICLRGPCTAWAQRQYALGWWHTHGNEWRQQRARETVRARTAKKK